jgi:hypothetical protein
MAAHRRGGNLEVIRHSSLSSPIPRPLSMLPSQAQERCMPSFRHGAESARGAQRRRKKNRGRGHGIGGGETGQREAKVDLLPFFFTADLLSALLAAGYEKDWENACPFHPIMQSWKLKFLGGLPRKYLDIAWIPWLYRLNVSPRNSQNFSSPQLPEEERLPSLRSIKSTRGQGFLSRQELNKHERFMAKLLNSERKKDVRLLEPFKSHFRCLEAHP